MPKGKGGYGKRALRNPSKYRGISGDGSNAKGGGSSGKHKGGMGMGAGHSRGKKRSSSSY